MKRLKSTFLSAKLRTFLYTSKFFRRKMKESVKNSYFAEISWESSGTNVRNFLISSPAYFDF